MEIVKEFIENNEWVKWVFSGIGVTGIAIVFGFMKSKGSTNKTNQKSITAGGDVVGRDKRGN